MKTFAKIFILMVAVLSATFASAQSTTTTYNLQPGYCGVYAANYTCSPSVISPSGTNVMFYEPEWNGRFGYVLFYNNTGAFNEFGNANIDSFSKVQLSKTESGIPNRQGYVEKIVYSELTTFHQAPYDPILNPVPYIGYTGSTAMNYTVTTMCCSSGRGASEHSTFYLNFGTVTTTVPQ